MDNISRLSRMKIMRAIRSEDTGPERMLRSALRAAGAKGARRHARDLPGRPDFVWREERMAVFVDGCFWHGCPWHYHAPHNRRWWFWKNKIHTNCERDYRQTDLLVEGGWRVVRVWECQVERPFLAQEVAEYVAWVLASRKEFQRLIPGSWGGLQRIPWEANPCISRKEADAWISSRKRSRSRRGSSALALTA